jgi:RIO-like serine/threonine protein kinase
MEDIVKFSGHSGCEIYLKKYPTGKPYVLKIGEIRRNTERLWALRFGGYPVPKIYVQSSNYFEMEYIHGLDIKTYLIHNPIRKLSKFIIDTLENFQKDIEDKDYTDTYNTNLKWIDNTSELPFTREELVNKLPKVLPKSMYHGDMTLENLISSDNGFYMIDAVTVPYDSYVFDVAKMRQDMECKWFLRNENAKIDVKLKLLQEKILNKFPIANNDSLLILMLLRVLVHCKKDDSNYNFIMKEIHRLWK